MATSPAIDLGDVARGLGLLPARVESVVELLDSGNTVPFITRYRKDQTGGLDEEKIRAIHERVLKLRLLAERKQTILRSIESQGKLTPELSAAILAAETTRRLEDLYLPFKPKKQTLATLARSRGLDPLAQEILRADPACANLDARAADFIKEKEVATAADALLGAGYILAELFSERADLRGRVRAILERTGKLATVLIEPDTKRDQAAADEPAAGAIPPVAAQPPIETAATDAATKTPPAAGEPTVASTSAELSSNESTRSPDEDVAPAHAATSVAVDLAPSPVDEAPAESALAVVQAADVLVGEPMLELTGGEQAIAVPATALATAESANSPAATAVAPAAAQAAPSARAAKRAAKAAARKKVDQKRERLLKAFRGFAQYGEAIAKIPPHRVLAINRGEKARILRVRLESDVDAMQQAVDELLVPPDHPHADFLRGCARDALTRFVLPSLEREVRRELTDRAEWHAVDVFARNLRKLLLQPPVRDRRVLAIDPGFKSGCKLVALDEFGNLLDQAVIHLTGKEERRTEAKAKLVELVKQHQITAIVIGNGTGCRESEQFVAELIAGELAEQGVAYAIVNEAGASVYSTSPLGREEFPTYDATLRGAISIGRRLQDPLSELVKIDPANIGVGMYQHDVKAKHLRESLDAVVESCVNYVGVDLNTASPALLRYVSGLNQLTAQRLYDYRREHGPFKNREQLKTVSGIGEGTFVQAAGFLKIVGGDNPLDATWIHPESYAATLQVLEKLTASPADLADTQRAAQLAERAGALDRGELAKQVSLGELTLGDIMAQLTRPGRDPRESLPPPVFKRGILKLDDLTPGMELAGTVLNVVDFGAFVDIGLKDSGLVHISQLANRYVQDPHDVVSVGDIVKVWVLEVDKQRRRVSLTMIEPGTPRATPTRRGAPATETAQSRPAQAAPGGQRPGGQSKPRFRKPDGGKPPFTKKPKFKPPAPAKPKPKPKPIVPLTEAMKKGKAPLRTFGDLKQFWTLKQDPPAEDQSG